MTLFCFDFDQILFVSDGEEKRGDVDSWVFHRGKKIRRKKRRQEQLVFN
jgi:hypothetical protein